MLHDFRKLLVSFVAALPAVNLGCSRQTAPSEPAKTEPAKSNADSPESRREKAIADFSAAIERNPKETNDRGDLPHFQRGRAYAEKGDNDKAIADFTEAIRLYPEAKGPYLAARRVEAYNARAEANRTKGDYDKAIADYTEVINFGRGSFKELTDALAFGGLAATALYKRGICYDEKGEHDKAMSDYREAIRLGPELKSNEDLKKRLGK
jgi:tetratricopeptide (TPR) repeat protein